MNYLFENYPQHSLSLDVNAENDQAVNFYRKNGLRIQKLYVTPEPDNVEFALFETPLDKKGKKLDITDPELNSKSVQTYFLTIEEYHAYANPETYESNEDQTSKKEEVNKQECLSNEENTNESSDGVLSPTKNDETQTQIIDAQL